MAQKGPIRTRRIKDLYKALIAGNPTPSMGGMKADAEEKAYNYAKQ